VPVEVHGLVAQPFPVAQAAKEPLDLGQGAVGPGPQVAPLNNPPCPEHKLPNVFFDSPLGVRALVVEC
jgi:hypothetical protein